MESKDPAVLPCKCGIFCQSVVVSVGADYADSEIIAHLVACLQQYPTVKTVFDIGEEDSKLLMIHSGTLTNFQMNKDCGGGTGAMIEAIANRLGVDITTVGRTALDSKDPVMLPASAVYSARAR